MNSSIGYGNMSLSDDIDVLVTQLKKVADSLDDYDWQVTTCVDCNTEDYVVTVADPKFGDPVDLCQDCYISRQVDYE